jgi:uncharacterized protein (DUF1330 family)
LQMLEVAYLIVLARIHERAKFGTYVQALPPVYEKFGGRYLCLSPQATVSVPEGAVVPAPQALVVSVWASMARLQQFWFSEDYRQVAALRAGTGEFHVGALTGRSDIAISGAQICISLATEPPTAATILASETLTPLEGVMAKTGCLSLVEKLPEALPRSGIWLFAPRLA